MGNSWLSTAENLANCVEDARILRGTIPNVIETGRAYVTVHETDSS